MIVDASALVCIIRRGPGYDVILRRLGARGKTALARVRADARIEVLPFTEEHTRIALDAFTRFGQGRHPAALNFCDCCSYATAAVAGEPLLCVGDDFRKTDLELVPLDR